MSVKSKEVIINESIFYNFLNIEHRIKDLISSFKYWQIHTTVSDRKHSSRVKQVTSNKTKVIK